MSNRNIYIIVFSMSVLSGAVTYFVYQWTHREGFIDNNRLFREFVATAELKQQAEQSLSGMYHYLDSVQSEIRVLDSLQKQQPNAGRLSQLRDLLYVKDSVGALYSEQLQTYQAQIHEQSWNLLNKYVLEFGKKKHYRFIFGANGNGSLMYSADATDITAEVLEYANKEYNGQGR